MTNSELFNCFRDEFCDIISVQNPQRFPHTDPEHGDVPVMTSVDLSLDFPIINGLISGFVIMQRNQLYPRKWCLHKTCCYVMNLLHGTSSWQRLRTSFFSMQFAA